MMNQKKLPPLLDIVGVVKPLTLSSFIFPTRPVSSIPQHKAEGSPHSERGPQRRKAKGFQPGMEHRPRQGAP